MEANELNHEVGAPVEPTGAAIARRLLLEAMAREASATGCVDELTGDAIGRFAAMVRAQALEEAAVICDQEAQYFTRETMDCAEAIRRRAAQACRPASDSVAEQANLMNKE